MRLSSSLSNRIFLACTLLATVSLGFAFTFVNAQVTGEVEAELRRYEHALMDFSAREHNGGVELVIEFKNRDSFKP